MALNYVTVTGTFDDGSGNPLPAVGQSAYCLFTPSTSVYASGVPLITPAQPIQAPIINGALSQRLLATDNAGLTFGGLTGFFYWTVTLVIAGQASPAWSFFLPHTPTTVDLSALANTAAGTAGFQNPMTTLGDMIDGGTAGVAQRLPVGSAGQALIVSAGAPAWGTVPVAGGGTGQATQQAAIDALTGTQSAGKVLRSDGTHATLSVIQPGDLAATAGAAGRAGYLNTSGAFQWGLPWVFDVTSPAYGAKGDGQVVLDGAMGSGSAVLTSASGRFVPGDVAKAIQVKLAGASGVTTLVTTIASYQSATQVTLTAPNASGGAVSGATVLWGTDDTAAFQAAINAAGTYLASHPYAQVFVPPPPAGNHYAIAGALSHANSGNAQLTIPVFATTGNTGTLEICGVGSGSAIRHWLQTTPQVGASAMVSYGVYSGTSAQTTDISANGQSAMIGGPTGPNGYGTGTVNFSNLLVILRNLTLVTTHSSFGLTYGAAWLWGQIQAQVIDVGYGTTGIYNNGTGDFGGAGVSSLGSGISIGLGMPAPGNQNNIALQRVTCGGGYTYGLFASEHAEISQSHVFYCWGGLCPVGSFHDGSGTASSTTHKIRFTQLGVEGCNHTIVIIGTGAGGIGPFIEGSMDAEAGVQMTDDGHSGLASALGEIHWTGTTGGSISTTAGTQLAIIDERQANGPGAAWSLTLGTAKQNTQWRWATVTLAGGTSITAVQVGNLRGGSSAPAMTSVYTQASAALPPVTVRVPPGGWLNVAGTGTAPTASVVYD